MKERKLYVSDPWILKQYISDKPGLYAQKAEFLIIYQVNKDGEEICFFTYEELDMLCSQYRLDYDEIKIGLFQLLEAEYLIDESSIRPYRSVEFKEDGIYIELDERIVDHYYNPLVKVE